MFPLTQTELEDRDLLVSVLSYLEPKYKWSFYADRLSTMQLYKFLAVALKELDVKQMRQVLQMLPHSIQQQLEVVIVAGLEKEKEG